MYEKLKIFKEKISREIKKKKYKTKTQENEMLHYNTNNPLTGTQTY